ncbi:hypothetical protein RR47_GL001555 [Enterococcus columbae DSM 7374 = ATCC 51263]|nr:hypothetical protein RR47_GL001555 [Enterococcus columbae DSM 7374 = ATCC 51263]
MKIRVLLSNEKIKKELRFSQWRGEFSACLATEHRQQKDVK